MATWDEATRDVVVLLDDGTRVEVPGAVVDPRLRLLRLGQRVRLEGDPDVTRLTLLTLT